MRKVDLLRDDVKLVLNKLGEQGVKSVLAFALWEFKQQGGEQSTESHLKLVNRHN